MLLCCCISVWSASAYLESFARMPLPPCNLPCATQKHSRTVFLVPVFVTSRVCWNSLVCVCVSPTQTETRPYSPLNPQSLAQDFNMINAQEEWLNTVNLPWFPGLSHCAKRLWCHVLALRWLVLPLAGGIFKTVHRIVREVSAWPRRDASCQGITAQCDGSVRHADPPAPTPGPGPALTLTPVLGAPPLALPILTPENAFGFTLLLWSDLLEWCVLISATLYHTSPPHFTGRTVKSERLRDRTEKDNDTVHSSDPVWYSVYHGHKEEGGGRAPVALRWKEQGIWKISKRGSQLNCSEMRVWSHLTLVVILITFCTPVLCLLAAVGSLALFWKHNPVQFQ